MHLLPASPSLSLTLTLTACPLLTTSSTRLTLPSLRSCEMCTRPSVFFRKPSSATKQPKFVTFCKTSVKVA